MRQTVTGDRPLGAIATGVTIALPAEAQRGELRPGLTAECSANETGGRGRARFLVSNHAGERITLFGVTPYPLIVDTTGLRPLSVKVKMGNQT